MKLPRLAGLQLGGLFPPALGLDDVRAAVAVDVTDAYAVRESLEMLVLGRDRMERPEIVRPLRVPRGIAQLPGYAIDQFRLAVAVYVGPSGRFVAAVVNGKVFLPGPALGTGVLVPKSVFAGESHLEHVQPAITVEIAREREEVVRVAVRIDRFGLVDFVPHLEVGPLEPPGSGDDVYFAVVVEIAYIRPFAVELVGEDDLLELR